MKRLYIIICLIAGISLCCAAQEKRHDVLAPIAGYISTGNTDALSVWFADNLEIFVISGESYASKDQARQVLNAFFNEYTPRSCRIVHTAGRPTMKYAIGELHAGGETFRITLFLYCKEGGAFRIEQIKIERP